MTDVLGKVIILKREAECDKQEVPGSGPLWSKLDLVFYFLILNDGFGVSKTCCLSGDCCGVKEKEEFL